MTRERPLRSVPAEVAPEPAPAAEEAQEGATEPVGPPERRIHLPESARDQILALQAAVDEATVRRDQFHAGVMAALGINPADVVSFDAAASDLILRDAE